MKDIKQILEKLKIASLNAMQKQTAKALLNTDKDIVVLSATGSGKTFAYMLPLVQLLDEKSDEVQAVIIVPGRELALQSHEVFKSLGCGLRSMPLYGGRATMDEHRQIRNILPQVIFVTPGRLNDHLAKGNVSSDHIKYLVIDEFDKCLQMGFFKEMKDAVDNMPFIKRRILLSATQAEQIPSFVHLSNAQCINCLKEEPIPNKISLYKVDSPQKDKLDTLVKLLCSFGDASTIVFLNYRDSVERVSSYLADKGFTVSSFHGGLDQRQRESAIYRFSNGSANVLVSTDLASRGLDIPDVDNIIHYHLPVGEEEFVHRVGRTGRWNASGRAFILLGPTEHLPEYIKHTPEVYTIPDDLSQPALPKMVTLYIGKGKKEKISKGDIVGFLCKTGGITNDKIGKIDVNERFTYVAVNRDCWQKVIKNTRGQKLKGIKTIVELVSAEQ